MQDDKWSSLNEHLSTNGGQKTHTGGAEPLNTSIKTPEVLRQGGANVVSIPSGSTHWNLSHLSPVIMFQRSGMLQMLRTRNTRESDICHVAVCYIIILRRLVQPNTKRAIQHSSSITITCNLSLSLFLSLSSLSLSLSLVLLNHIELVYQVFICALAV